MSEAQAGLPRRSAVKLVILAAGLLAAAAAGSWWCDVSAHPDDPTVEKLFRDRRQELEALVGAARQARYVGTLEAEGGPAEPAAEPLRALMKPLGIQKLSRSADGRTALQVSGRQIGGVASAKGLLFTETPPDGITEGSLDTALPVLRTGEALHRKLDGLWYLYLSARQPHTEQ